MVPLPENHFDEGGLFVQGSYFKEFDSPEHPPGGRVFLDFDGVAVSCSLWLNGKALGRHKGPYTPFSFDITDFLLSGKPNLLKILVSAREDPDIPPFGGVVDYLVPGGIYRGVWMRVQERFWLEELFARPKVIGFLRSEGEDQSQAPSRCKAELEVEAWVRGGETGGKLSIPGEAAVEARLEKDGRLIASVAVPARECVSETGHIVLKFPSLSDVELWDCDRPSLYAVRLVLGDFDSLSTRIGFRTARFTDKGFFLNGFRIFLQGLNRHQAWPASGYAMGPGPQRKDAELIARDYGSKIVRTSHYPQSPHFLDACDELGLLVFEELPGWQHIGGETWKEQALDDLAALILRDRNHPSIVLWGTRINESKDDRSFYARTAGLAKRLDPDRQTGGVRYLKGSELLEDVYTFNDFTHDGGFRVIAKPAKAIGASGAPYMITEHNGHMYPTKRFDQEERLAEHARRHARVLNAAMGDPAISGCIGWCAFDYHTHKDFGSGDRVCYHGVADMDRIPKFAAQLYASQQDPSKKIVLEAASLFAKGERSAARLLPVEVYTNCDAVDLYRGGDLVGRFYPDRKTYPYLDHPPVVLDDFIGRRIDKEGFSPPVKALFLDLAAKAMAKGAEGFNLWDKAKFGLFLAKTGLGFSAVEELVKRYGLAWGTKDDSFELVGILDGKEAARRRYGSESDARELRLGADVSELRFEPGGEWNAARVLVQVLDGYGRPCRFAFLPVRASVEGPGRILGPQEFSLIGGERAFWVATTGRSGSINVTAEVPGFPARTITLRALST
jgi:beta-galactosidase